MLVSRYDLDLFVHYTVNARKKQDVLKSLADGIHSETTFTTNISGNRIVHMMILSANL